MLCRCVLSAAAMTLKPQLGDYLAAAADMVGTWLGQCDVACCFVHRLMIDVRDAGDMVLFAISCVSGVRRMRSLGENSRRNQ